MSMASIHDGSSAQDLLRIRVSVAAILTTAAGDATSTGIADDTLRPKVLSRGMNFGARGRGRRVTSWTN